MQKSRPSRFYTFAGRVTWIMRHDFVYAYYDDENRLVSVTPRNTFAGSLAIENAYDHRSRRIRKIVNRYDGASWNVLETLVFVWDGWNVVLEQITFADNTTRTVEYFWGSDHSGSEQGAGGVGGLLATRIDGVFYVHAAEYRVDVARAKGDPGLQQGVVRRPDPPSHGIHSPHTGLELASRVPAGTRSSATAVPFPRPPPDSVPN